MVVLPAMWEFEAWTPLPSPLCVLGTGKVDALIHGTSERMVVTPQRRVRERKRKRGKSWRGAFSSATKFETRRVRPVPVGNGDCAVV